MENSKKTPVDRTDARLLAQLQRDSARSLAELAETVAISPSACHRRVRALEASGVIAGYGARLDPARLGLGVLAFVQITLTGQSREAMERFEQAVEEFDDILECYLMAGSADYLLRIAARDLADYDRIHRDCLSRLPGVASIASSFSIRRSKAWQGYRIAG